MWGPKTHRFSQHEDYWYYDRQLPTSIAPATKLYLQTATDRSNAVTSLFKNRKYLSCLSTLVWESLVPETGRHYLLEWHLNDSGGRSSK